MTPESLAKCVVIVSNHIDVPFNVIKDNRAQWAILVSKADKALLEDLLNNGFFLESGSKGGIVIREIE